MSYENTLEKVIIRLDGEEKEKDAKIAELSQELTELKAYKAKLLAHVKYSSTQEEVEIIKLEQQAKGLEDYVSKTMDNSYILHLDPEVFPQSFLINLNATALRLRNQAKALKEQGE
jgi:hypothetical protein